MAEAEKDEVAARAGRSAAQPGDQTGRGVRQPAEAGERLGIHENTVRYRLRKMAEIANLQLDDAKKRLAMMIELAATDAN